MVVCPDGRAAVKSLEKAAFDAAILDISMPGLNGIEVLEQIKQVSPNTEVVMMTGHATLETAIEAGKLGAFDYITKPAKLAQIETILNKIAEKRELTHKNIALQTRLEAAEGSSKLVGHAPVMESVHRLIQTVAPTDSTVMINGETGTGKDVAARTIYSLSDRVKGPFVPVNCGALSEALIESELFGHRKGAFTGADRDHKGLFEVADGGTLFLDEVGELNKNTQVKLLRFLESGEIRRLGETEPFRVDVRVICATNRDLKQMVKDDEFREDLYFRINTFQVKMPPLRERRADIPDLARHLLSRAARRPEEQVAPLLTAEAIETLLEHEWPGNVRELANAMEYAWILSGCGKNPIGPEHLPADLRSGTPAPAKDFRPTLSLARPEEVLASTPAGAKTLKEIEMEHILKVLEKHKGNKPAAAAELGIVLKTLYNKLNQYQEEQARHAG
ncbi:MAG: sigma-54 dependent transcriptional regulator [Gemmataceae bacterium]